ncbi:MAG: hypothetical protein ABJF10_30225 [Chthoniobacter sp.]|uniref:hypothetical protein n=1 Tax=Chthoniobacter sp. TaxID=2510640 RepID=UPI0032A31063
MTDHPAESQRPHLSLRRCFWLCLPALVIGTIVRLSFLVAVPEVFYGGDSSSYFAAAHSVYIDHEFDMPPKRRYVYPLLLVAAPPVPFCNTAQIVALVQHLAGLGIIFGIGWVTGNFVRRPALWVPLVTLFPAIWPRMIYYEHEMICETLLLSVFIATVALAAPRDSLASNRRLIWFCLFALLIVAVKPSGRPLWFGLIVAAALITHRPFRWPWLCYSTFPFVILITFTSGGDSQGPWLFLSSTLPLVRTEGEPYAAERALLRPTIEAARADLPNYSFRQKEFKKLLNDSHDKAPLGPAYARLVSDHKRFASFAQSLGREAVLTHPFQYLGMIGKKIVTAAGGQQIQQRLDPQIFWDDQSDTSEIRWREHAEEMRVIYEMDEPTYRAMAAERSQRTVWFSPFIRSFADVNWLQVQRGDPGEAPLIRFRLLGGLALWGLVMTLLPSRFVRTSLLWLPLVFYLFGVFAVGDTVTRYLHPIEWILFVLIAIGLDATLDGILFLHHRLRPSPHPSPPPPNYVVKRQPLALG